MTSVPGGGTIAENPANFSGCPSNPVNRKQQKKQPNKNIWTEKAKERAQKSTPRQQKPSYASVTAQNISKTNTFDANSIMEHMGQMMQHNWAVGSAIDIIAPDTPTHFNHNAPSTVIDIGFAANFSHSNVFTVNELSSDHNPVIFDFVTNCQLPPLLQTLKTSNWIKFQEILHYNMPGNPTIDNLDQAVQNFSNIVSDAINTSTSTRISKTSHLRLPINIRELIKTKNRFRKLWNNTRYPLYKREVNALVRQIRNEINEHKNRTWKNLLSSLNVEDNSLYNLHKRITKKYTVIPPLHGPSGMAFSDFEKAEAFKDTLEVTFQENAEPYSDDKIEEVESLVNPYSDNFNTLTPPLTSPLEVRGIIKKLPNRKSPGPD
ncbi:probable RNA-directed DNA polymerase from transposon X-element [Trichonephila clavipes]|nr:probable RNA-directed DNA polymerase from transposon X-element [Trichonephila clavipes]